MFTKTISRHFSSTMAGEGRVAMAEMHAFMVRCMQKSGAKSEHCTALADLLAAADYRGHYSHGLNRLDMYVRDIQSGITVSDKEPELIKETAATAFVNGNNVLGPVVGKFCMDIAIKKAKEAGIGWVTAKGSNHFGIAGWYAMRAMEQDLIGMAFTNTSPLMVPTRAKTAALGTNPIACAAPANNGDSFVLDMATTAVALGKLELNERKGIEIPLGWGCDTDGKATPEPAQATGLMPLGGTEECKMYVSLTQMRMNKPVICTNKGQNCGYKGYGLAMMVELFCGILAGADFGPNIRRWKTTEREANLGQCFVAIDPSAFAPGFTDRMSQLNDYLRGMEKSELDSEVLVPGDPERIHMKESDTNGGILYHANQIKMARNLASELGVEPPKVVE